MLKVASLFLPLLLAAPERQIVESWPVFVNGNAVALVLFDDGGLGVAAPDGTISTLQSPGGGSAAGGTEAPVPVIYRSRWHNAQGRQHEVETSCRGISAAACARRHKDAVDALQALYPAVKDEKKKDR